MFAPIQNVVSTRDLFNSNPCRDFWDSQQFSQAASGSQGSQSSSLELLSQSINSQNQKHESSYDGWYNTGNSQKTNEEEPVKYYMKYLSKPPLFADQSKGNKEKGPSESYKEFIEAQKTKAVERDQRELLDNFIGLLKDYTKEVQNAMQSFKDCLESSAANNNKTAENIKSAAEKSFTLVDDLKEDFQSSFKKLRTDLKENDELKSLLFKKEQELTRIDMELQLQKNQIDDLKRKEQEALRKEDEFKQKEKRLLERIKEAEMRVTALRDTPPPSQESLRHYGVYQSNINQNMNQVQTCLTERNFTSRNDFSRLPVTQEFPLEHNAYIQVHHSNNQMINGIADIPPVRECERLHHFDARSMSSGNYPTASITPVQQSSSVAQLEKENLTSPSILLPLTEVSNGNNSMFIAPNGQAPILSPSANRVSLIDKNRLPRKSPIATVLPQVQTKPHTNEKSVTTQAANSSRKETPLDPSCIFSFDLTLSPQFVPQVRTNNNTTTAVVKTERSQCQEMAPKPKTKKRGRRRKRIFSKPAKKYDTRSQNKVFKDVEQNDKENMITNPGKRRKTALSSNLATVDDDIRMKTAARVVQSDSLTKTPATDSENRMKTAERVVQSDSLTKAAATDSDNRMKTAARTSAREGSNDILTTTAVPVNLKRKVFNSAAHKSTGCVEEEVTDGPSALVSKRPRDDGLEEISKSIEGCLKSSFNFKRQNSEKRTLDLSGSSLFEIIDEEVSIRKIAESIRKHAQKRSIK